MRYIILVIWSALLVSTLNYVVSSINNATLDAAGFKKGLLISLVISVLLLVIDAVIPKNSPKEIGHQE
ncbi:YjzD family protein [Rummeliibacillus pycnus]|uniref:YjzD family protein n=1 Tax=Rummeliibacillus pycnus TaxID=101070 RepID=UPI000C9C59E0|nr:YjzD family protein [Rummeliibacillus pycnus]